MQYKSLWIKESAKCINVNVKYFSGLLPLSGRCHIPNALRSYRIKTFDNLDKTHIIGKVRVSRWLFCDRSNTERKSLQKLNGFGWHPVAVCGMTPKQNCTVTSIFLYKLQIWNTTYSDIWHSFYAKFGFKPIFYFYFVKYNKIVQLTYLQ